MDIKQKHIHIEKIKLLYSHSLIPIVLSAIAGVFLVFALWEMADRTALLIWLGITFLLACLRAVLILRFKHVMPYGDAVLKWENPYVVTLLLVFVCWTAGLIWLMPRDNLTAVFIVSTFLLGLAGAAISWYSPLRYLQMTSVTLALLPMTLVLLTLGYRETFWVGISACFMYVSCMLTSVLLHKTFNGNLELAYDLEQAKLNAEDMARTDALTGLNNRRAFFDKARALFDFCKRNQQPISAVMMDIDYFKAINDRFGHACGDLALTSIATLLKNNLRESDLLCRFGGEEFAILLPNTSVHEAERIANDLKQAMTNSSIIMAHESLMSMTASFGVAELGESLEDILGYADKAMYLAKNGGRNNVMRYQA